VITRGLGSGKSSLAFDTIYAEGSRRYVESLSAYARQFLEQMEKPDVDVIEGSPPHIDRAEVGREESPLHRRDRSRRSTTTCGSCSPPSGGSTAPPAEGDPTADGDADRRRRDGDGGRRAGPAVGRRSSGAQGGVSQELAKLSRDGFSRVVVDGETRDPAEPITLDKQRNTYIDVVVDRLKVSEGSRGRLADSVALCLKLSEGLVRVVDGQGNGTICSEKFACPDCGVSLPRSPRACSPSTAPRRVPRVRRARFDDLLRPRPGGPRPREDDPAGAIDPWSRRTQIFYRQTLASLASHYRFSLDVPFGKLPERVRRLVLFGSAGESIRFALEEGDANSPHRSRSKGW